MQSDHLPVLERVQLGADEPHLDDNVVYQFTIVMLPEGNHG